MSKQDRSFDKFVHRLSEESGLSRNEVETMILSVISAIAGSRLCCEYRNRRMPASFSVIALHSPDRENSSLFELVTNCLSEPNEREDHISREFCTRILSGGLKKELALWDLKKAKDPELLKSLGRFHFPHMLKALRPDNLQEALEASPTGSVYWKNTKPAPSAAVLQQTGFVALKGMSEFFGQYWNGSEPGSATARSVALFFSCDKTGLGFLLKESGFYGRFRSPPLLVLDLREEQREIPRWNEWRDSLSDYVNRVCTGLGTGHHLKFESTEIDLLREPFKVLSEAISRSRSASHLRWMHQLAPKLYAIRKLVQPTHDHLQLITDTRRTMECLILRHLAVMDEIAPEGVPDPAPRLSGKEAHLLEKVKAKGPSTFRTIQRSFHSLKATELRDLLSSLNRKELIQSEDGLIRATSPR